MKQLSLCIALILGLGAYAQRVTTEHDPGCNCQLTRNYYDDGTLSTEFRQNASGERVGVEKVYYPSGQLQYERTWKQGRLDGEGIHYHRNGEVHYKEVHDNGAKTGTWTFYDDQGDKVQEITYHSPNGKSATYVFYSAGVPYLRQVLDKGKLAEEVVLNEEIYAAKLEEAEAMKDAKKE